ncbi:MAG: SRPBCC family protein [Myxococcota bacterium]
MGRDAALPLLLSCAFSLLSCADVPARHVATVGTTLKAAPGDVFTVVADLEHWPQWATQVDRMVRQADDAEGRPVWDMHMRQGVMRLVVSESTPPEATRPGKLVTLLDDDDFSGSWTWTIAQSGSGSDVEATEDGVIHDPVMRATAHYVVGYTSSLESFVSDLADHFGEKASLHKSVSHPDG